MSGDVGEGREGQREVHRERMSSQGMHVYVCVIVSELVCVCVCGNHVNMRSPISISSKIVVVGCVCAAGKTVDSRSADHM